jgi:DNA recombination protein RmuC
LTNSLSIILGFFAGLAIGGTLVWIFARVLASREQVSSKASSDLERATLVERLQGKEQQLRELKAGLEDRESRITALQTDNADLQAKASATDARLEQEQKATIEKLAVLEEAKGRLADAFKALSAEALNVNSEVFLTRARETLANLQQAATQDLDNRQRAIGEIVKPLTESLDKVDNKIRELESMRASAYASLHEQVRQLATSQGQLQAETSKLVSALRSPIVRGRWGEIQLRRVVELAGMVHYCDFTEQSTIATEDGRLRPDLIVRLPNSRQIVVDSKAPIEAYYQSLEAADESARAARLKDHARQVRTHLFKLGEKSYWEQLGATPEFVVLFLPGETFFSAALEQDPTLIEYGVDRKVILATPTTLIALLKAVAYGWKQEQIAEHAVAISKLGRELHERLRVLAGHFADVGKKLDGAVDSYNRAVGSLESRVLVSARKFKDLGASSDREIEEMPAIEKAARYIQIEETRLIPGLLDELDDEVSVEADSSEQEHG